MKLQFVKSKWFKISVSVIFTAICVVFIVKMVDFNYFFKSLKELNIVFVVLAIVSLLVSYYFRVLRYELLLDIKNAKLKLFSVSAIHYSLNKILPARSGELSFPILLKKHLNYNYGYGITTLFFARILDFSAMIFLLLVSSVFIKTVHINIIYVIVFSVGILFAMLFAWGFSEKILDFILIKFENNEKKSGKIKTKIIEILRFIHEYKKSKKGAFLSKIALISIFNWIAIYFYYYFVVLAFDLKLDFFQTTFAATVSNFTFMLPNSVGNIGPFEGAWAIGFYLIGIGKDVSIPIGLFANIFATLVTVVMAIIGLIFLKNKLNLTENKDAE